MMWLALVTDIFLWSGKYYHWNLSASVLFLFLYCCLWTLWFNEIFFQRDIFSSRYFSEWYFFQSDFFQNDILPTNCNKFTHKPDDNQPLKWVSTTIPKYFLDKTFILQNFTHQTSPSNIIVQIFFHVLENFITQQTKQHSNNNQPLKWILQLYSLSWVEEKFCKCYFTKHQPATTELSYKQPSNTLIIPEWPTNKITINHWNGSTANFADIFSWTLMNLITGIYICFCIKTEFLYKNGDNFPSSEIFYHFIKIWHGVITYWTKTKWDIDKVIFFSKMIFFSKIFFLRGIFLGYQIYKAKKLSPNKPLARSFRSSTKTVH